MANALPDTAVTTAGTPVTINVLANDTGSGLVITSFSNPANGSLVFNGDKSFTYTPAAGFVGEDTFSYTVRDAQGTPATAEVTISVVASGGATVATDDYVEVVAGGSVIVPVLANDLAAAGGTLQVIAVSSPGHGVVNVLPDQSIRYVPQTGFVGIDSFTYTVIDEQGATASATVTVKVVAKNSAPIAVNDSFTVIADTTTVLAVLANDSDPEGGPLQIVGFTMPSHGSLVFNVADKTFSYTPQAGYQGPDQFTYTVRDNRGASASASVTLTISQVNASPVAVDDQVTTEAGVPVTIDVLANDDLPAGQQIGIIAVTLPFKGRLDFNADKTITYTPNLGFVGTDDFTYTIGNGKGGTAKATVTIEVTPGTGIDAYQNGYGYRRRLAVPTSSAKGASHQNFPLWVDLAGSWLKTTANDGTVTSAAGHDLRFELADGTKLAHELELYDAVAGKLGAWVRVPELRADTATELMLYYGKPGLQASEAAPRDVWQDYLAVWHLPDEIDASDEARVLTAGGNVAGSTEGLGNGALALAGDGVLKIDDAGWLEGLSALSVQLRSKAASIGHDQGLLGAGTELFASAGDLIIRYQSVGFASNQPQNLLLGSLMTTTGRLSTASQADTQTTDWQSVALAWQSDDTQGSLYLDGKKVQPSSATTASGGLTQISGPLYLGASTRDSETGGWVGLLDEVRLRPSKLADAWITAEHANQARPEVFYGIGAEDRFGDASDSVVAVPFDLVTATDTAINIDVLAQAVLPADATAATIQSVGQPVAGLVSVIDGKIRYTPTSGFVGVDVFTYTLRANDKQSTARIRVVVEQAAVVVPPPPAANTINVANYAQLASAITNAQAGDAIVLASGTYSGNRLTISRSGTAGDPIVIRAANLLGANVPGGFVVTGSHVVLEGLAFESTGAAPSDGMVRLGGTSSQVLRCRFRTLGGQHVTFISGTDGKVLFCEFSSQNAADPWQASMECVTNGWTSTQRHANAEIGYCYFRNLPSKPEGEPYSTRSRAALIFGRGSGEGRWNSNGYVHHNLFVNCGNCRLSINSASNRIEYCTITGKTGGSVTRSTDFSSRFGSNNVWRGCWAEDAEGYMFTDGGGNKAISCVSTNGGGTIAVFRGTSNDINTVGSGVVRALDWKLTACQGPVTVGFGFSSYTVPAENTRLENHSGSVNLVSSFNTGTVQTGQMTETPVTPLKLTTAMVGPSAAM